MFLTPDGAPFFARHVFPEAGPLRPARLPRAPAARRRGVSRAGRGDRRAERRLARCAASRSSRDAGDGALPARAAGARARGDSSERFDPRRRRLRRRAQVSARGGARVLPARMRALRGDDDALAVVAHDARANGRRRHPRPARRRLLPLQRRRASGRSRTSRRCSTTTRPLLALYADARARDGRPAFGDVARGIVGWLDARDARARRRVLFEPRRRQRGRGRASSTCGRATRRAPLLRRDEYAVARAVLRPRRPAELRGPRVESARRRAARRRRGATSASPLPDVQTRLAGARAALLAGARARVRPGPRRQDPDVVERAGDRGARPRGARAGRARVGRSRVQAALDALRPHGVARRAAATPRATASDVALNAYLDDYAFLLAALLELDADALSPQRLGSRRTTLADALLDALRGPRARRVLVHEPRPRSGSITGRSPAHDNATPSGNGVAAQALIALGHLASEPRYVEAAERAVRLFANGLAESAGVAVDRCWSRSTDCTRRPPTLVVGGDPATCARWQRHLEHRRTGRTLAIVVAGGEALPGSIAKGAVPARAPRHGCAAGCSACRRSTDSAGDRSATGVIRLDGCGVGQRCRRRGRLIWPVDRLFATIAVFANH